MVCGTASSELGKLEYLLNRVVVSFTGGFPQQKCFLRGVFPPLQALCSLVAKMKALIKEEVGRVGYVWFVTFGWKQLH